MYEIIRSEENDKEIWEIESGEFFIIKSSQSFLDKQEYSFHTGDLFLKTSEMGEIIFISSKVGDSSWVGNAFDIDHPMFENMEVEIIKPKKIIFHI